MFQVLDRFLPDPPPPLVFEIGESAVVAVRRAGSTVEARAERALPAGVLKVSPADLNIVDEDRLRAVLLDLLADLAPIPGPETAVLLPDGSSRLTVFEFDSVPAKPEELRSLIGLRLAKAAPFDVASARIAYQVQNGGDRPSIVVAATGGPTLRQYERVFSDVGLTPGYVGLSTASALNLAPDGEMTVLAKMSGRAMTMAAVDHGAVRLVRTVEPPEGFSEAARSVLPELVSDLYPTFVYIEDHLGAPVSKLLLAGFGELPASALEYLRSELGCPVEPLCSAAGPVGANDAGIWGRLHAN